MHRAVGWGSLRPSLRGVGNPRAPFCPFSFAGWAPRALWTNSPATPLSRVGAPPSLSRRHPPGVGHTSHTGVCNSRLHPSSGGRGPLPAAAPSPCPVPTLDVTFRGPSRTDTNRWTGRALPGRREVLPGRGHGSRNRWTGLAFPVRRGCIQVAWTRFRTVAAGVSRSAVNSPEQTPPPDSLLRGLPGGTSVRSRRR